MHNRLRHLWPAGSGDRPKWACFDRRQQHLFEQRVREYFRNEPDAFLENGWVNACGHRYGLDNLAQLCLPLQEHEWPQRIAEHFDSLRRSHSQAVEWVARKGDIDWARQRLLVRLYRKGALPARLSVVREDLPGLDTVLVADLPTLACNVSPEDIVSWGRPQDESFASALHNLAQAMHGTWHTCALDPPHGRVRVHALEGASLYPASHVLHLDRWPERLGRHGTLVAVPNRHIVTVYPIDTREVLNAVGHFLPMVHYMHDNGPGQISRNVYWRRPDGSFLHLPSRKTADRIEFLPPYEFMRMIRSI